MAHGFESIPSIPDGFRAGGYRYLYKTTAEKIPVLCQKCCVLSPETGVFRRFLTVFDGPFCDPGRRGGQEDHEDSMNSVLEKPMVRFLNGLQRILGNSGVLCNLNNAPRCALAKLLCLNFCFDSAFMDHALVDRL